MIIILHWQATGMRMLAILGKCTSLNIIFKFIKLYFLLCKVILFDGLKIKTHISAKSTSNVNFMSIQSFMCRKWQDVFQNPSGNWINYSLVYVCYELVHWFYFFFSVILGGNLQVILICPMFQLFCKFIYCSF